ncbi:MAG: helix-turn-helix domain-containing protein [Actinomycetota bacterium]
MDPALELKTARKLVGLSQAGLAKRAGVPQSTVARIETGAIDPRASMLDRLLRACSRRLQAVPALGVGVDRTQIQRILKLTPEQRLDQSIAAAANLKGFLKELRK